MLNLEPRVVVISSVSGGGKTTIVTELLGRYPVLKSAITATTRPPRGGELHGVHYYFLSKDDFESLINQGGLLEHALVHGNYYGVPLKQVEEALESGTSILLNIDVQGMESVRKAMGPRVLTLFLVPPDDRTWEERLRSRGTDSEDVIQKRLEEGRRELARAGEYDYQVVNDNLDRTMEEVISVLQKERIIPGA